MGMQVIELCAILQVQLVQSWGESESNPENSTRYRHPSLRPRWRRVKHHQCYTGGGWDIHAEGS